jgi:hypothetical protein
MRVDICIEGVEIPVADMSDPSWTDALRPMVPFLEVHPWAKVTISLAVPTPGGET